MIQDEDVKKDKANTGKWVLFAIQCMNSQKKIESARKLCEETKKMLMNVDI